jgi:hypothetical protein
VERSTSSYSEVLAQVLHLQNFEKEGKRTCVGITKSLKWRCSLPIYEGNVSKGEALLFQMIEDELTNKESASRRLEKRLAALREIAFFSLCKSHSYQRADTAAEWARHLEIIMPVIENQHAVDTGSMASLEGQVFANSSPSSPMRRTESEGQISISPTPKVVLELGDAKTDRYLLNSTTTRPVWDIAMLSRLRDPLERLKQDSLSPGSGSDSDESIHSILDLDELEDWIFVDQRFTSLRPFVQHVGLAVARAACMRALQEMLVLLDSQNLYTTYGVASGGPTPSSSASTIDNQSQGGSAGGSSASNRKRRRTEEYTPDDGDDYPNKRPRPLSKSDLPATVYIPYFACPFFQNCPERHERRGCRQRPPTFNTVSRVK